MLRYLYTCPAVAAHVYFFIYKCGVGIIFCIFAHQSYSLCFMSESQYEFIKKRLAPCGLHCGRCFAFTDGDIYNYSNRLKKSLGNFDVYAARFVKLLNEPVFRKYPEFKEFLAHLSSGSCNGCRAEQCKLFKSCNVRSCSEARKVEFCFQCDAFPCDKTGFDEHLYRRHVHINERMKAIGVESYYEEIKDQSRY